MSGEQKPVYRRTIIESDDESAPQPAPQVSSQSPVSLSDKPASVPRQVPPAAASEYRRTILEEAADPVQAPYTPQPVEHRSQPTQAHQPTVQQPKEAPPAESDIVRFRPTVRPPAAHLLVFDDFGNRAEIVRVRTSPFRVGRCNGDFTVPHDSQMSSEHFEITREQGTQSWTWKISDLNSTNGTFFRVSETVLQNGQELFLGGRRYRFETASHRVSTPENTDPFETLLADSKPASSSTQGTALVEVNSDGNGRRFPLNLGDQILGNDSKSCTVLLDDPMLAAREARISQDSNGQWFIRRENSQNGIWVRVASVTVPKQGAQFQSGEQRFEMRLK